jgi:hypothetical protein
MSLPGVFIEGVPNASPPDIRYPPASGTSVRITDASLDGGVPGSGTIDFRIDQAATWGGIPGPSLGHGFTVDYGPLSPPPPILLSPIVFHEQTARILPDPSVLTNGTGANDSLAGTLGWTIDLNNQSQGIAVTNPAITVNSGWSASHFPGLTSPSRECPPITRAGSTFPFTWTEPALSGQPGVPGPCGPSDQMNVNSDMSFTDLPVLFNSGFDSSRTVDTTVIRPRGSQSVTVRVTTRATMYGTAPAQIFVNISPPGFFASGQVVTSTSNPSGVGPCPQSDPGTSPCLQQSPTPGQAFWILNRPVLGSEYDFGAVLTRTDPGSTPVRSLPDVRVGGHPHASPPDIVYPESSGTSVRITDASLDGPLPGSGAIDFRVDQSATWGRFPAVQLLQHDFIVQYSALFPTPFGLYPSTGAFVIGDGNAGVGSQVNFWGSQWAQNNSLTGGSAPNAFKGFEGSSQPSDCGGDIWTAAPGNSGSPPPTVPTDMTVIVASSVTKSGSTISGNVVHLVVVKTDPGYQPNPGHPGTGQVEAIIC